MDRTALLVSARPPPVERLARGTTPAGARTIVRPLPSRPAASRPLGHDIECRRRRAVEIDAVEIDQAAKRT